MKFKVGDQVERQGRVNVKNKRTLGTVRGVVVAVLPGNLIRVRASTSSYAETYHEKFWEKTAIS